MVYGSVCIGISVLAVLMLGIRLWKYRKQVEHLLSQTDFLAQEDTNYRLSSYCRVGKTEKLVSELNRVIQLDRDRMAALKRGNRSYKESIISISHDIRTPLTSAKGYIQMLLWEKEMDADKKRAYMENIEQRIDDVTDMLTQLFEYARIEADEIEFVTEEVNVANLFTDVIAMFYDEFMQRGCEPLIEMTQTPCYICADKQRLRRIMENLLKNALVHGTGGYRFCLSSKDNGIWIEVSNRTDSITEEDMEHIFDRFYTTDLSRTRKTTGLGLAIVKRFVQGMGGTVGAELSDNLFTITVVFPETWREKSAVKRNIMPSAAE